MRISRGAASFRSNGSTTQMSPGRTSVGDSSRRWDSATTGFAVSAFASQAGTSGISAALQVEVHQLRELPLATQIEICGTLTPALAQCGERFDPALGRGRT